MAPRAAKAAVFLDRDGVLNEDLGYVHRPEDLKILPGVPEALKELKRRGFLLVVISNQSGVARGKFGLADVEAFNDLLRSELVRLGAPPLDDVFFCPHGPDDGCRCRKPRTGMIDDAVKRHDIDPAKSFLIGDKFDDVECAVNAGIRAVQVASKKDPKRHAQALACVNGLKDALAFVPSSFPAGP